VRLTRTKYLNQVLENLLSESGRGSEIEEMCAEWRGNGWYLFFSYPRHFGDCGEFLGREWRSAAKALKTLI